MGEGLVVELQRLAQSSQTSISELLRRAKTVAVKLDLDDARAWIEHELNGYPSGTELPPYRTIPSELRVKNPYHGWQPVVWGAGGNLQEHFATAEIRQSISEVEVIAGGGEGHPHSNLNQEEMDVLLRIDATFARLPSARFYGHSSFVGIVEGVRAKILDWSLALEKKGVLGDGMVFNDAEKREAAQVVLRVTEISLVVLFLSANPDPNSPLSVEKEQNRIVKVRNGSKYQGKVRIEGLPDLDLPEFAKSLRLHAPGVVHFSGHGGPDGSLLMRDENGKAFAMQPQGVAKLLLLHKGNIRLVVLNACYSSALSDLLAAELDCVIGMEDAVSDDAAILFAQTLYGALFDGATVGESFETSLAAVQARYQTEKHVPRLRAKPGINVNNMRLVESSHSSA
jgi:hypothetical protein